MNLSLSFNFDLPLAKARPEEFEARQIRAG